MQHGCNPRFQLLVCNRDLVIYLAGPLLTNFDFSASELEETDEPLFEGTPEVYHV